MFSESLRLQVGGLLIEVVRKVSLVKFLARLQSIHRGLVKLIIAGGVDHEGHLLLVLEGSAVG